MKTIYLYLSFCILLFIGCDDNGDDGYYHDRNKVYFLEDSVLVRLGEMPVEVKKYVYRVPVKVLGKPVQENTKFRVKVDQKATTAPLNSYTAIPQEIEVLKDSVNAYIPVELIRDNIEGEIDTTFRIVLYLESSENFELGPQESLETRILFTNYLMKPDWWVYLESLYWGPYQKEKYQKMIEIWGGPISFDDYALKMTQVIYCGYEMYLYFQKHPEYNMVFPDGAPWPYE
ncbi:DUF4843 domain-containing protein [uncultured Sanguibacteroides sp.]|uniref:DUF4843 domain-containing protein n=1 Tax=uncultured Sanguibacteroides sp. TaxID=1635151 RepID=UPI0025F39A3D|nr:DUF4843 domain-containing protein [uncultured Sanguibacteroides sp.]